MRVAGVWKENGGYWSYGKIKAPISRWGLSCCLHVVFYRDTWGSRRATASDYEMRGKETISSQALAARQMWRPLQPQLRAP